MQKPKRKPVILIVMLVLLLLASCLKQQQHEQEIYTLTREGAVYDDDDWLRYAVARIAGALLATVALSVAVFVAGLLLATGVDVAVQLLMSVLY